MKKEIYDYVVIGGGPAGMMSAIQAAKKGKRVILLEKNNELGKKLSITGGGRCNIANAEFDIRKFLANFPQSQKFLFSPFSKFNTKDTFNFFEEELGLKLVVEARKRVFPKSQKATDVVKVLVRELRELNVKILTKAEVVDLRKAADGSQKIQSVILKNGERIFGEKFVLATGGWAAPKTGSTGDGFRWLKKLGLKVKMPNPNIVPLKTSNKIFHKISGTSWPNLKISFIQNGEVKLKKQGKVLFTHFGLSAPLILNSAFEVKRLLKKGPVVAVLDFFPDLDEGQLDKKLIKFFEENKNKKLKNVFKDFMSKKISEAVLDSLKINIKEKKVNEITREERKDILKQLKNTRLNITGTLGMDKAVIADGGILLEEVDTKTMKVKKIENLYVVGDVLNINRPSGGYSLQLCWTTGYVAGTDID